MNTLKSNQMQRDGLTWEVSANGNDIIIDSLATNTMRIIVNGFEDLQNEVQDNLPAAQRHKTSIQKIAEFAHEDLAQYAYDNFDASTVVLP